MISSNLYLLCAGLILWWTTALQSEDVQTPAGYSLLLPVDMPSVYGEKSEGLPLPDVRENNSFRIDGQSFPHVRVTEEKVGTSLQIVMHETSSASGKHGLVIMVEKPEIGSFSFGEGVYVLGRFPSKKHVAYNSFWEDREGNFFFSNGKVVIRKLGKAGEVLEGSVSGVLVYHEEVDHQQIHEEIPFAAEFSTTGY